MNSWGVFEWKCFEKMYWFEKEVWIKEREMKILLGGFVFWVKRVIFGSNFCVEVKLWDV